MSGTVGKTDTWTVTFTDSNGDAVTPAEDVVWTVTQARSVVYTEVQVPGDAVATGTFELKYTPASATPYAVKATTRIDGVEYDATPTTERAVSP
jgi:hypothetical protein